MFISPLLLKFSFSDFPPFAPFFDGFVSRFRRTRRLKIQSGAGRVAQTHFGEKSGLQIIARKQINQFVNRFFRHRAALFGKFFSFHFRKQNILP